MTDDRMPPHDEQAEVSVLGAMLLSELMSERALSEVVEILKPEDFYRPRHQAVFRAALSLQQAGQPADPVTVAAELERRGELGRVGGAPYLHTLIAAVPTAANAGYYAEIVAEKAILRRMVEAGTRIVQYGYRADGADSDVAEVVERARAEMDSVAAPSRGRDTFDLAEMIPESLAALQTPNPPGLSTGFLDLDEVLGGGLQPGALYALGARPGVGKSLLCLQMAAEIAAAGHGALMVSLEMPRKELMERFWAAQAGVSYANLRAHRLSDDEWYSVHEVADRARSWPLSVMDAPNVSVRGIHSRARELARTPRGLGAVFVDYLQLVAPVDRRASRQEQVGGIARDLKLMARALNVPVVAPAQVNRGPEGRTDKRPLLSDLRESGDIESNVDGAILLHEDQDRRPGEMDLLLAKNRNGPKATITVAWQPKFARARDLARY